MAEPAIQLDGLPQEEQTAEVRSIDPFGRRSAPVRVTGTPLASAPPLPGHTDTFDTAASVHAEVPGSRWHVSGYRGCVDLVSGADTKQGQLTIQLGCGADDTVMRSRAVLKLNQGPELARVTAITDAAAPNGAVTFDLVPGPADRVGIRGGASLPAGTIRVSISDAGVQVTAGAGVPRGGSMPEVAVAPRRGAGVLHKFDVALTTSGVRVFQDDTLVGGADLLAPWPTASVLLGMTGPPGRQTRVHLDAVSLSDVVPPTEQVVEFDANLGTQRVLRMDENAPGIGVNRRPLVGATSARVRATVTLGSSANPAALVLQAGDRTIPMRPATPDPPAVPGTDVTLVADLPPDLLTGGEPPSLSPLVIRGTGSAAVLQSYLEIVPGPTTQLAQRRPEAAAKPRTAAMPAVGVAFKSPAGADLGKTVSGTFQLEVTLDNGLVQRDADEVVGIKGFEVFVNDRRLAAVPTNLDGPSTGGKYPLTISLPDELPGEQTVEIRVHPADSDRRVQSTLVVMSLVS